MGRRSELAGELARLRRLMREPKWSDLDEAAGMGAGDLTRSTTGIRMTNTTRITDPTGDRP